MATLRKATVGDFIIHEGPAAMSREQATVVAQGPLADGEPLCKNAFAGEEGEADYKSWREEGYPTDNLPTALLIGAIDAPVNPSGTVYPATLLCGFAVVNMEAIAATGEPPSEYAALAAWASLYQRSAIIATPTPALRASLSDPAWFAGDDSNATPRVASVSISDGAILAEWEGFTVKVQAAEGNTATVTLPPGLLNRRYRVVNDAAGQTLLVFPDTGEYIKGGVPGNNDAINGTVGFGRMYQGALDSSIPAGAYIDLIGIGDGWRVLEVAMIGNNGVEWVAVAD